MELTQQQKTRINRATAEEIREITKQAEIMASRNRIPGYEREDLIQEFTWVGLHALPGYDPAKGRTLAVFVRTNMEMHRGHLYASVNRDVRRANWRATKFGSASEVDALGNMLPKRDPNGGAFSFPESHPINKDDARSRLVDGVKDENWTAADKKKEDRRRAQQSHNDKQPGYLPTPIATIEEEDLDLQIFNLFGGLDEDDVRILRYAYEHGLDRYVTEDGQDKYGPPKAKQQAAKFLGLSLEDFTRRLKNLRGRKDIRDAIAA